MDRAPITPRPDCISFDDILCWTGNAARAMFGQQTRCEEFLVGVHLAAPELQIAHYQARARKRAGLFPMDAGTPGGVCHVGCYQGRLLFTSEEIQEADIPPLLYQDAFDQIRKWGRESDLDFDMEPMRIVPHRSMSPTGDTITPRVQQAFELVSAACAAHLQAWQLDQAAPSSTPRPAGPRL